MNSPLQDGTFNKSGSCKATAQADPASRSAEETLRLIATLPAPEGLVDRVQAGLRAVPRTARILSWPESLRPVGGWMHGALVRGAAAAAIVFVVAGGGWGIYMRVPPAQAPAAKVIVMPARVGSGGFSTAGSMHKPETLKGPVLTHSIKAASQQNDGLNPDAPSAPIPPLAPKTGKAKKKAAAALPQQ